MRFQLNNLAAIVNSKEFISMKRLGNTIPKFSYLVAITLSMGVVEGSTFIEGDPLPDD